ncbi:lipase member M-like [Amblyomma americanum]
MGFVALVLLILSLTASAEDELELQARLTPCELIRQFGYPCDVSYAATDDGYVLEVDRIRHGCYSCDTWKQGTERRYPVLLLPSLMATSDMWFLNYPSQSPGFLLADDGFDVWAMNARESVEYSHHRTMSKEDEKYWQWSFDEIGRYDLAAGIDHVLTATGASKLTLFSLSQGVTIALVLLSTRPQYNEKVELVVGYAPMGNITDMRHPVPLALQMLRQFAISEPSSVQNRVVIASMRGLADERQKISQNMTCTLYISAQEQARKERNGQTVISNLYHFDFAIGCRTSDLLHKLAIDAIRRHASVRMETEHDLISAPSPVAWLSVKASDDRDTQVKAVEWAYAVRDLHGLDITY